MTNCQKSKSIVRLGSSAVLALLQLLLLMDRWMDVVDVFRRTTTKSTMYNYNDVMAGVVSALQITIT